MDDIDSIRWFGDLTNALAYWQYWSPEITSSKHQECLSCGINDGGRDEKEHFENATEKLEGENLDRYREGFKIGQWMRHRIKEDDKYE